ncbi:hypothetical protein MKX01_026563 [Papaver californicum]|nr:hypothetical protein MKX01_026563 [Papaver californicum]
MLAGGIIFLIGLALNGTATNVMMLILGRILLGIGVGYANQSVPVYLSEMAPAKLRGALNMGFQLAITIRILTANLVNYGTTKIKGGYGWRVSLALAAVPTIIITIGAIFLPDTPNSLFERDFQEKAKTMLQKIRGNQEVEEEFQDLIEASEASKKIKHPWRNILQPRYRPQLIMSIMILFFQQFTDVSPVAQASVSETSAHIPSLTLEPTANGPSLSDASSEAQESLLDKSVTAPNLHQMQTRAKTGFDDDAALMSAVITGFANIFATFVSIGTVDRVGRRMLFLEGGIQMLICQVFKSRYGYNSCCKQSTAKDE